MVAVVRLCLIIGVLVMSIWLMYSFMSWTDALDTVEGGREAVALC